MTVGINIAQLLLAFFGFAVLQFLLALWIKTKFEASIKIQNDKLMEQYKFDIRTREQATKVAEYFSYFFQLRPDSPDPDYKKANQLGWELALWLPEDIYRQVKFAVHRPDAENNILSSLISIRRLLLKTPGTLNQDELFFHAPNAAKLMTHQHSSEPR